jgi:hypothetical protein
MGAKKETKRQVRRGYVHVLFGHLAQTLWDCRPVSGPKVGGFAAGPSVERVTKVRSFAESHEFRYVVNAQFGGTEIFLCKVAADVVEDLRK